jgi:hypothetical protein
VFEDSIWWMPTSPLPLRIQAPTGTRDLFYSHVSPYFGGDNYTYDDPTTGFPNISFNGAPDVNRHTSDDSVDKLDTTQLKRSSFLGLSVTSAADQVQRAVMSNIEKECAVSAEIHCDVVTLFSGAVYNLYSYKRYTDVRLVFAPEFDAAFFGGDPDNFTYPRYDLDIAFFRVYENDKPAHLENYLPWSPVGVKNNELIFVSGNPGSTNRWRTISQLDFLRDVDYPNCLAPCES